MKKETKQGLAVVGGLVGTALVILGVTKVKAAPPEFTLEPIEWDTAMPFAPGSVHSFTIRITNPTTESHIYRIEVYWVWGYLGGGGGHTPPGETWGYGSTVTMPSELGIYNMTVKLWVDDVYINEFVISKVEVGQIGQTLWGTVKRSGEGEHPISLKALIEIAGVTSGYSDLSGTYKISGIPKGVYQVIVSAEGYQAAVYDAISVIPGDANCDGVVDIGDVTKVERIILGIDDPTPGADANQDGVINMLDVTKIERIILGLDAPLTTMRFDPELRF